MTRVLIFLTGLLGALCLAGAPAIAADKPPVVLAAASLHYNKTPRLTPGSAMREARPFAPQTTRRTDMGQFIELKAADGQAIPAYVAQPAGTPKGGVVVIQEIFGVNSHIQAVADGYAAQGYLAVAPAIFHRVRPDVNLGYTPDDMSQGQALKAATEALPAPGAMQDIQAAIDHAAKAGKVGIVGYCYGGLLTWRAASELRGLSAAVPYYGGGMTTPQEAQRQPKVPVMAHFGQRDHWITMESVRA